MRWLITGAGGMVGMDLRTQLRNRDEDVVAVGKAELDISNRDAVLGMCEQVRPEVIVNCAAYTKVDDCEVNEELATRINGTAVGYLADGANLTDALLVQISTDFVFNGNAAAPYEVADLTDPLSAYGRSKLAGENAAKTAAKHIIVRTSWLFGASGWNFVEAIRKQIHTGKRELRVVNDQRGRPTYTPHLADAIVRLAQPGREQDSARGIFHYADEPEATWFDLTEAIVHAMQHRGEMSEPVAVYPISSSEISRPAKRPAYSVLSTARYEQVTGTTPEWWQEGLDEYLEARPYSSGSA